MEAWNSVVNLTLLNAMDKYAKDYFSDSFIKMLWNDVINPFKGKSQEFNRFVVATSDESFKCVCLAFCSGMFEDNIKELTNSLNFD